MINISNLTSKKSGRKFIYSDLNLNFEEKQVSGNNRSSDVASGNDLVIDFDVEAIKNSIRNILFQRRYLSALNINLKKYIGEPASEANGETLGDDIERAIAIYEPRIKCEKILVHVNVDQHLYQISLFVRILNLNEIVRLDASFTHSGNFVFLNN